MTNDADPAPTMTPTLRAAQVYTMAVISLGAGLALGYLMRGSQLAVKTAQSVPHPTQQKATVPGKPAGHHSMNLEDMKVVGDKQAAPLLEKLKVNPIDSSLLVQVGAIYHTTHRFKEAADYYSRALDSDPKDVAIRTRFASSLYRNGNVDEAITQLNRALTYDPKNANALFDLGMIKLHGKSDPRGALVAWQRLLKSNPQLSPDRKATVLKLMADVMTMMGDQHGIQSTRSDDAHGH